MSEHHPGSTARQLAAVVDSDLGRRRGQVRRVVWASLLAVAMLHCEPKASAPPVSSAVQPSAAASTAAAAPRAVATDSASTPATAEGLAALPPDGMVYVAARPAVIDHLLVALPAQGQLEARQLVRKTLGAKAVTGSAVAEALSLDPSQPVLFAAVAPPPEGIRKVVAQLAAAPTPTVALVERAQQQIRELDPPLVQLMRVRATLATASSAPLLEALASALHAEVVLCDGGGRDCKSFKNSPFALLIGKPTVAVVYLEGRDMTIDVAQALFLEPEDGKIAKALDRFHRSVGGPAGDCSTMDSTGAASVCARADRAGDFGLSSGLGMLVAALSGAALAPAELAKIVELGQQEAGVAQRIARREPRWLDDGTLTVRGTPGATQVVASWATTEASDQKLRDAFEPERCAASGEAFGRELVSVLAKVFDAQPASPKTADKQIRELQEGGWAVWPVVWARSWPAYVPLLMGGGLDWTKATRGKSCVRYQAGRLEIRSTVDLSGLAQ